jgi:YVTN family beta-propeller protein
MDEYGRDCRRSRDNGLLEDQYSARPEQTLIEYALNAAWRSGVVVDLKPLLALLAIFLSASAAKADNLFGTWSDVSDWPLIAIHAALTPDGRVLTYGTDGSGKQTGYFIYDIWDPNAGLSSGHLTLNNMTLTDIFCSSQIILPQSGDILIAGGDNWAGTRTTNTGNANTNLFSYGDNTLAQSVSLNRSRWYSSSTVLVSGEIYIQGGAGGGDLPEVRQTDGAFRLLTGAPTNNLAATFPRNFLAPDGRVFGYDTVGRMYFVAADGAGAIAPAGQFAAANAGWTSSAAMYRPGKILQMGGNSKGAVTIDINGPQPIVAATQSMSSRRQWVSASVLADGRVLATGGSEDDNKLNGVNNSAELWNPDTGAWQVASSGARARLYHSSALLLPDASVLVAGGGAPGPLTNTNAEIYYPSYLYDVDGELASRPQILSAPHTATVGDSLAIEVDSTAIERVTLVKSGSVTHSVNMDQRFLELPFVKSGNMLDVSLPLRSSDAPPGFYLLFVFDAAGVPSVASMLRINIDQSPDTSVNYTPAIGGGGGAPFQLACSSDEILVGVHGKFEMYVNQIGPQCVRMDQLGRWIGDPVNGTLAGNSATGTGFSKTCPRDFAVSGFRGHAGQYVNQLEMECRALTPAGGLTGEVQYLGGAGGPDGTGQGPFSCGTGNPVFALYGRSGGWLDSFGVQCRPGAITPISINSRPVVVDPGSQSDVAGLPVDLQIYATDGDGDPLSFNATSLPPGLQIDSANALITGTPVTTGNFVVTVTASDGSGIDAVTFDWTISVAPPLSVVQMPVQAAALANTVVTYTADASGGVNKMFSWDFGDGSPATGFTSDASITHAFTRPGIFYVTLTVVDDFAVPQIQTFVQTMHLPLTSGRSLQSTRTAFQERAGDTSLLWVVNADNDSVTAIDASSNLKVAEIAVGTAPKSVAVAPDGRIWATIHEPASIAIIDPATMSVAESVALPFASQPYGLVFSTASHDAYVVLEATGQLLRLDALSGSQLIAIQVGSRSRHVAINADGSTIYVSRFVTPPQPGESSAAITGAENGTVFGGEVSVVDSASMSVVTTLVLRHSDKVDAENQGAGVPNYLGAMAISPDGISGWVPSKQDNIGRGTLRSGSNINFQNTVRAISSRVDLGGMVEDYAARVDHDDSGVASAAVFDPLGIYLFVALESSREVAIVDVHGGSELFRIDAGRAPQSLTLSPDGLTLYVGNLMDRSVDIFDLTPLRLGGQWNVPRLATVQTIADEKLDLEVLVGKQFFYDARDARLARDRYLSCASCHNDGGSDGRVWDLTGMGEGVRSTIGLQGSGAGHGRLHWSQNFDEVQDFEGQIRGLSAGTGLMSNADFNAGTRRESLGDPKAGVSVDLDALAAYVASLTTYANSPHRNSDGSLTADGLAGREIFRRENCAACHSGERFSDSAGNTLHDIGTLKPASGMRLGQPLPGIDTPTLRGVWSTAPYLHDGSAMTIADAVAAHSGISLGGSDMQKLVAYLSQIDAHEERALLPNIAPDVINPGAQASVTGISLKLIIAASDADGDDLQYSATGLPPGLAIDAANGEIRGAPVAVGSGDVTVTVSDNIDSASVTFSWQVTAPKPPPVKSSGGGGSFDIAWLAALLVLIVFASDRLATPLTGNAKTERSKIVKLLRGENLVDAVAAILLPSLIVLTVPILSGTAAADVPQYDRVRVLAAPMEVTLEDLTDQNGESFKIGQLNGKVVVILFGFTNCPDVCPIALQRMRQLEVSDIARGNDLAFVMISVDAERDSPAVLKEYLANYSSRFIGVTGDVSKIKRVAKQFSAAFFKGTPIGDGDHYTVSHSRQVFVVDTAGRLRAELYDASLEAMQGVVAALLAEERAAADSNTD